MTTKLNNMSDVIRNIQDYKVVALATLTIDYTSGHVSGGIYNLCFNK